MGSAASATAAAEAEAEAEGLGLASARAAAGDLWPGTARFRELSGGTGGRLPVAVAAAELERLRGGGSAEEEDLASGEGLVELGTAGVREFLRLAHGSPALCDKHVADRMVAAALTAHESAALAEARRACASSSSLPPCLPAYLLPPTSPPPSLLLTAATADGSSVGRLDSLLAG